jgi:hypothetical protein
VTRTLTRLQVLANRGRLDRALAAGADPRGAGALRLRAAQLERPAARARVALGLERVVCAADEPARLSAAAPVNRAGVRAARPELLALARALRGDEPVRAQGVALAHGLLVDGASPLYAPAPADELARALADALEALAAPAPASAPPPAPARPLAQAAKR